MSGACEESLSFSMGHMLRIIASMIALLSAWSEVPLTIVFV